MLRRDVLSLGMLLTAGGLASTLPGAAEAATQAKAEVRPGLLVRGVKGTWKSKGNAHGSLAADVLVQSLTVNRATRALKVHGRIASQGGDGLAAFVSQTFVASAKLTQAGSGGAACGVLTLAIGTIHLPVRGGLVVKLEPIKADVAGQHGQGRRLGDELCTLAGLLNGEGSLDGLKDLLQQINATLAKRLITVSQPGS